MALHLDDPANATSARRPPRRYTGLIGLAFVVGIFLLTKGKFVLLVATKLKFFSTGATMLASVGAYALLWGWRFAALLVLLIFIHELGHVFELRRQGIPASAPVFIPFIGAAVILKEHPRDALSEAKIGIAGPIVGSLGAAALWLVGSQYLLDSDLLRAAAFVGFAINLFNLLPITPLDGGRIVAALHPVLWVIGIAGMLALVAMTRNPIMVIIAVVALLDVWGRLRRWRAGEAQSYYDVRWRDRIVLALSFVALAGILAVSMQGSFVPIVA